VPEGVTEVLEAMKAAGKKREIEAKNKKWICASLPMGELHLNNTEAGKKMHHGL
jgi:hypothetical protein